MMDSNQYTLEVRGLRKEFDQFVLDNVDLCVPAGTIVGLIGENGAGKSTTIKTALDLLHRDGGEVRFFGNPMEYDSAGIREQIGVTFDGLNFNEAFTAPQAAGICRNIYSNWDEGVWNRYMKQFRLPENKKLKDFSKGMKVKFNLAVALSHHARLLILDEPTSGLDPVMRDDILDVFLDFVQDESHGILLSSHITSDLEKVADYIVFLHEGKVLLTESKDEMLYRYGILRCGRDQLKDIDPEDMEACQIQDYQVNVLVKDRQKAARRYSNMVIDPATIDEIMLLYIKGRGKDSPVKGGR